VTKYQQTCSYIFEFTEFTLSATCISSQECLSAGLRVSEVIL